MQTQVSELSQGACSAGDQRAPVEPTATDEPQYLSHQQIVVVLFGLMAGVMLAALDQSIVGTALPRIVSELGGLDKLAWVVTAYLLTATAATPLWGKISDLYGRRHIFQAAILIFLAGSVLCGLSQNLPQLIAFRAIQGIGGGGLMALAFSIIGDVIPPRERGRYQGYFGAVFGVSSVAGPLLGGWFTDGPGWRWIFYINLPLGLLALAVINATFKPRRRPSNVTIDYVGAILLAIALTCVILISSLGSSLIVEAPVSFVAIALAAVLSLGGFIYAETVVPDPLLPLSLFRNRAFVLATAIGFIVGMALFGSITLLPVYFQVVKGLDPTSAGLHLTPMMLGVFVTSIVSGQIITRIGRYKVFPVVGTALMTIGLALLSRITVDTSPALASTYMLLLGAGLGMVMQILVMAVQNAVAYEQLGVATSGTTLFRSIGGTVGAALFGGIFAYVLEAHLRDALPGLSEALRDPDAIASLAEPMRSTYLAVFVDALHPVFITATVLALISFFLALAIKEVPLRSSIAPEPVSDAFQMPRDATSLEELERIVARITARENRWRVYQSAASRMGIGLEPDELWLLARLGEARGPVTQVELEARLQMAGGQCEDLLARLLDTGMASASETGTFSLSAKGAADYQRLVRQREVDLRKMLADWKPDEHPEVLLMMRELAKSFASYPPTRPSAP